ncbi:MAG: lipo-like protein [Halofilum sp. (in: g-proteobacteria)]
MHPATSPADLVAAALQPGDVLLVEGTSRLSSAIKYLTQSTWSHAAFYVGDVIDPQGFVGERRTLVEADVNDGVRAVPFSLYAGYHTRICRPVGLDGDATRRVCDYMIARLGYRYDVRNVFDLARYLIQTPPVPAHWKRRMLALGSGDPTRAICSSLIAQAFQSIHYPVLPHVEPGTHPGAADEIHHIRHHSLFAPRDFDVSPYFDVIKPRIAAGFDYRELVWEEEEASD